MLPNVLSMSASSINTGRERSQQTYPTRAKSQPSVENHFSYLPSPSPLTMNPMKSFFGDLLHLTPHHHGTLSSTVPSRSKISSSLSTTIPSDHSSRMRFGHRSVVSSFSGRSTILRSPQETRPSSTELTVKFRRAGKLILFAIRWCDFARKNNQLRSMAFQSYLQTAVPTKDCIFDKSNFKIQFFEILPIVRQFFQQQTDQRDVLNAHEIRQCLNDIKPFTRLPKTLQDQLLRKGWYECHEEQRTIVRQGERATCFYIILSGSVIPTYKRATDGNIETLDILKRGCTFGEKGLMTNSTQNFTVMSKTKLELLVLYKDDFQSIFMTKDRHCSKEDLKFLKNQVSFLRGFPVERLHEMPNAIQHCHFGPKEMITRDSRRMKHLFIVKQGSLAIWKRLDPNGPHCELPRTNSERIDSEEEEATGDNRTLFSEVQLGGDVDESTANSNALDADFRLSRLRRSPMDESRIPSALSTTSRSVANGKQKLPGIVDKRDRLQLIDYDGLTSNTSTTKLTFPSVLSNPNRPGIKAPTKPKTIQPDRMIYVHVKTLNEGQQFGLTDMIFPNQPELTLVSNECECLLINKSSFFHLASDQYKQNLRRSQFPYPTDSVFYKNYHTHETWKRFSQQAYLDAYERIHEQHPQNIKRSINTNERKTAILINAS